MIKVSRLDGSEFFVNALHVESVEATPDTVLTLFSGKKFLVREPPKAIVEAVVSYHRQIAATAPLLLPGSEQE